MQLEIIIGMTNSGNWIDASSGDAQRLPLLIQLDPLTELVRHRRLSSGGGMGQAAPCNPDRFVESPGLGVGRGEGVNRRDILVTCKHPGAFGKPDGLCRIPQ